MSKQYGRRLTMNRVGLVAAALAGVAMAGVLPSISRADSNAPGSPAADPLHAGFVDPANDARPRVWWHWMNGNITKEGIRKDIEWMHRSGIGGLQNFDAAMSTPQVVDKRLVYMSPEWKDAFQYAAELADQQGMELAIAASPGWSETGGPWVPPQDAMKKLVWASVDVDGGQSVRTPLPLPPQTTGPFQTLPPLPSPSAALGGAKGYVPPAYYSDISVLAFPISRSENLPAPGMTLSTGEAVDSTLASDGNYDTGFEMPVGDEKAPGLVTLEYPAAQTIRAATLYIPGAKGLFDASKYDARLEAEVGGEWRKVAEFALSGVPSTASFAPISARRFRMALTNVAPRIPNFAIAAPGSAVNLKTLFGQVKPTARIAELRLSAEAAIDQYEAKAAFTIAADYYALDRPDNSNPEGVKPASVQDVSTFLRPDGSLAWTPPAGRWRIIRFGYSLTGKLNHPATQEATGLEVDKYDAAAVERYIDHYLDTYASVSGEPLIGGHGVRAILTDSIEVGASNWTPGLVAKFKGLRGYDPSPWLPTLTGTIVGDRASSDRFLYDFRRTLADLVASEHYRVIADAAHRHGLVYYSEALENGRPSLGDDMAMRAPADIPMGAFWTHPEGTEVDPVFLADLKGAASVAHIYGKPLVAAESLTTALHPWSYGPADLKPMIDREFVSGVNRPVIHTSVHQPVDVQPPGLTLAVFGLDFNRLDTWAEFARPWVDYISRSSYLLQQGRNVADVAYFYGEEAPLVSMYRQQAVQDAPTHYAYDFVNSEVILKELSVENGELVSRGGARYRVLYLGGSSERMTLPVLKRLGELVAAGATVVGYAPESSPSLADDPREFSRLVGELWGRNPSTGRGHVIATHDLESALRKLRVRPDVDAGAVQAGSELLFVHRQTAHDDIYFLVNPSAVAGKVKARFRVAGKIPEIWRAETGLAEPASYRRERDATELRMDVRPHDALFVVFRRPQDSRLPHASRATAGKISNIDGPWTVGFQSGRGAPASVELPRLSSLSESADAGVRYFSGVATYRKTFAYQSKRHHGARVFLNLGDVRDIAEVSVNGKRLGYAWTPPYRLDVTSALKEGANELEISVADLWVNRLIGDAQPGAEKVTGRNNLPYLPDTPLRLSGLIGPVVLEDEK